MPPFESSLEKEEEAKETDMDREEKKCLCMFQKSAFFFFLLLIFYSSSLTVESWLAVREYISHSVTQQTAL